MKFKKVASTAKAPTNAGVKGVLSFIEALLTEVPYLQSFSMDKSGEISYVWHAPEDKDAHQTPAPIMEACTPYEMLRRIEVAEVISEEDKPSALLYSLLRACAVDRLLPVCFAVGSPSKLPDWLKHMTMAPDCLQYFTFGGCQVLVDENLPEECLTLFASHARTIHHMDACKAYKITLEVPCQL